MGFDPFAVEVEENGYTGTLTSVTYAPGKFGFQATFTTKHDEPRVKADGTLSLERPEFVSMGSNDNFRTIDNGDAFESVNGKAPSANSRYAQVVTRIKELCPAATTLVGLHVTWEEEGGGKAYKFTDEATGEVKEGTSKPKMMPVAVSMNGVAAPVVTAFDLAGLGLTGDQLDALTALALENDLNGFRAGALAIDGFTANKDAVAALGGDSLYTTLREG